MLHRKIRLNQGLRPLSRKGGEQLEDKNYLKCKLLVKEVLDRLVEDFNDEDYESALESIKTLELYIFALNKLKF
jgi:hypothetical protein